MGQIPRRGLLGVAAAVEAAHAERPAGSDSIVLRRTPMALRAEANTGVCVWPCCTIKRIRPDFLSCKNEPVQMSGLLALARPFAWLT